MNSGYKFKRSFYYEAEKAISESGVTFLLGPRYCGKTVCLKQLQDAFSSNNEFDDVIYVNAQRDLTSNLDKSLFICDVKKAIENNEKKLFLIDDTTYLNQPDCAIQDIQDAFTSLHNTNTKVVFTGSPSRALECWGRRAFAGDALFIRTDFLSYPEWLAFKGITEVSEITYEQFILGTREFYSGFNGIGNYLQGCLENTVASNLKSVELIVNNDCEMLDADKLLDVLYASLISSSDNNPAVKGIDNEAICPFLAERYRNFKKMDAYELKQALQFLINCGLITITYVSSSFDTNPYIVRDLLNDFQDLPKREIFDSFNISINYPMFYIDILKDILNDNPAENMPRGIVESHVRAILPDTGCFKYHDTEGRKIDYVSNSSLKAIGISVSDKNLSSAHFDVLPGGYEKIIITKDFESNNNGVQHIPYYRFIFEHSGGKELVLKH